VPASDTPTGVPPVELFVIRGCPHCDAAREALDWRGVDYVEHDVELEPEARARMLCLTGGQRLVPALVEPGMPVQVGWQGRGCPI
jgi:glutaredoxin